MHKSGKILLSCLVGLVLVGVILGGSGFLNGQVKALGKPAPVPAWKVTVWGDMSSSTVLTNNQYVTTRVSTPSKSCACYTFQIRILYNSTDKLMFSNLGLASAVPGSGSSKLNSFVDANDISGITNYLNSYAHPEGDYYDTVTFHIQLAAADVDSLILGIPTTLNTGTVYLSLHNDFDITPIDSLYGFTGAKGLTITKNSDGWTIVVDQSLKLLEQHTELDPSSKKTSYITVTPWTIWTSPVKFTYMFQKIS